ncbi:MAG: asparagine synthase-related protein, partial [Burkholderiaceae bacterium]|nr:asparagine synthase-related protein [Burkholderiaceae bacterium]
PLRERVRSALLDGALGPTGLFERRYIEQLVDAHQSGRRDFSASLWTLLMLEAFLRVVDQAAPLTEPAAVLRPMPVAQ